MSLLGIMLRLLLDACHGGLMLKLAGMKDAEKFTNLSEGRLLFVLGI